MVKPKTREYPNFYETSAEAEMRLRDTLVLYEGLPYYVIALGEHADGIYRLYLDPIGHPQGGIKMRFKSIPYDNPPECVCEAMDEWMEAHPDSGLIRKMINSPSFNRFLPFPLGMANFSGKVYYFERTPRRPHTQQGCTPNMVVQTRVSLDSNYPAGTIGYEMMHSSMFRDCVLGHYPSADEALEAMSNPEITNDGLAFARNFALLRGPVNTLFLAYKTDVVGAVSAQFKRVDLSAEFEHTKEVIEELKFFKDIRLS